MPLVGPLLLAQALATWALVGLIWTIQWVHYPLLAGFDRARFSELHAAHTRRIGAIVAPLMLIEAATAVAAAALVGDAWSALGLVLLLVVWGVTAGVSMPCHRRLSSGFDEGVHRRLVSSNWIRTLAWSARGVLVAVPLVPVAEALS